MNENRTKKPYCAKPTTDLLPKGINCIYWHGRSGRKYIHTIYSFAAWPGHSNANILLVRRDSTDKREIIWAGQTGDIPGLTTDYGVLDRARKSGANEIHVHLLGDDELMRQCIVEDLAHDGIAMDVGVLQTGQVSQKIRVSGC